MSAGVIAGFLTALAGAVFTGLAAQEIRGWLDAVPGVLLRLARRRLPPENRDTLYDEWAAELHIVLHRMKGRPLSRLVFGIRYAVGLLRTARCIADELGPARRLNCSAQSEEADWSAAPSPVPAAPGTRPRAEEDDFQAWVAATNCLLYENDTGPRKLNVGSRDKPVLVPREQAWRDAYAMHVLVHCDGEHTRLKAAAGKCRANISAKPHLARDLARAADLCELAARMVKDAGAISNDKARRRLVAVCQHETTMIALGNVIPEVAATSAKDLHRTLRNIDREP